MLACMVAYTPRAGCRRTRSTRQCCAQSPERCPSPAGGIRDMIRENPSRSPGETRPSRVVRRSKHRAAIRLNTSSIRSGASSAPSRCTRHQGPHRRRQALSDLMIASGADAHRLAVVERDCTLRARARRSLCNHEWNRLPVIDTRARPAPRPGALSKRLATSCWPCPSINGRASESNHSAAAAARAPLRDRPRPRSTGCGPPCRRRRPGSRPLTCAAAAVGEASQATARATSVGARELAQGHGARHALDLSGRCSAGRTVCVTVQPGCDQRSRGRRDRARTISFFERLHRAVPGRPWPPRSRRARARRRRPAVEPVKTSAAPWPSGRGPVRRRRARKARAVKSAPSRLTSERGAQALGRDLVQPERARWASDRRWPRQTSMRPKRVEDLELRSAPARRRVAHVGLERPGARALQGCCASHGLSSAPKPMGLQREQRPRRRKTLDQRAADAARARR